MDGGRSSPRISQRSSSTRAPTGSAQTQHFKWLAELKTWIELWCEYKLKHPGTTKAMQQKANECKDVQTNPQLGRDNDDPTVQKIVDVECWFLSG